MRMLFIAGSLFMALVTAPAAQPVSPTNVVTLKVVQQGTCRTPCDRVAVIFLHGIMGTENTWLNASTKATFPKLLQQDAAIGRSLDIYVLSYESFTFSGPPIGKIGTAVAGAVDPLMRTKRYDRVVLIGHSMGGIVAQAYLLHVKSRYGHQGLVRFPVLVTLGTPFEGSSLANLYKLASNNEQARILVPIEKNDFQQLMIKTMSDVRTKSASCAPAGVITELAHFAAYETKGAPGTGIVVDKRSAIGNAGDNTVAVAKDHFGIAKPANTDDPPFPWVKGILQQCIGRKGICTTRTSTCGPDFPRT